MWRKKQKLFRRERQAKQQHIIRAGNSGLLAAPAGYRPARIFPARLDTVIIDGFPPHMRRKLHRLPSLYCRVSVLPHPAARARIHTINAYGVNQAQLCWTVDFALTSSVTPSLARPLVQLYSVHCESFSSITYCSCPSAFAA